MSTNPAKQTPTESVTKNRIIICGDFGPGSIESDFLLAGFLQLFRDHEFFKDDRPAVVTANPARTAAAFDVAVVDDDLESMAVALTAGHVLLSVGEQFNDTNELFSQRTIRSLKRLLAGIIAGRPTGVIGAEVGPFTADDTGKMIADIFGRLDLVTVRDQASAITLVRSGLALPAITTADPAFGIPYIAQRPASTGRLGIDAGAFDLADDTAITEFAGAIDRLADQSGLKPIAYTDGPLKDNYPASRLAEIVEGLEIVDLSKFSSVAKALEALGDIDILLGSQYRMIIGAATRGVPSVALCLNPALVGLAQQFRLGNYAVGPDRMNAPTIARAAQQMLNNRRRISQPMHSAFQAKAARAADNIEQTARMLAAAPDLRISEIDPEDFADEAKSLVREVVRVMDHVAPKRKQKPAKKTSNEATPTIKRKPLPPEPLVTIYICAYNAGKWIEQALASVLEQTYHNLEILIVDDGSTDDTVAKIKKFNDPRINLHQLEHGGIARARTHAKENFRGDLIVCLDADDWIAPDLLAKQVALLQKHPEVDVTYCDRILVDEHGYPTGEVWNYRDYPEPRQLLAEMFAGGRGRIPNGSMMERAEVARQVGGYNLALETTEDYDYGARLAVVARSFRGINEPLYFYRSFMSGISGKWEARNFAITSVWRDMWERHGGEFLLGEEPGRNLTGKRKEAAYLCRAGDIACQHGEEYINRGAAEHFFEFAGEFYIKALALEPHNYTASSQVMKLTAAGYLDLQSDLGSGRGRKMLPVDYFYANQPMLDVLFEHAIPELLADGHETINIHVFQAGVGCEPYTLVVEARRRGLPLDLLRIRAFDSRPEMVEKVRAHRYSQRELSNKGRNYLPASLVEQHFAELPDGVYRLNEDIAEKVTVESGDITASGAPLPKDKVEIVIASSLWEHVDAETARIALDNLAAMTCTDGYLFLGGFYPARDAALAEHRYLEPVCERFEDVHNGWRYRRGVYGTRPVGLEPLDRRYPEWPWRYACVFRKREAKQLDLAAPDLLKTYWTERGKIFKKQYPAQPLDEQPVPRRIIQALQAEGPGSVLDYGCGFGAVLHEVRRALPTARLIGLDISRTVLFDGYKYMLGGTPVGLVESDGKTIPFPDDSFDTVFTHMTLIHVPHEDILGVLGEMVRVSRKTLYIGESADKEHEQFYYFAHDYPALFNKMGLAAEELDIPDHEKQPGTRLFRVDVTRESAGAGKGKTAGQATNGPPKRRLLIVSDRRSTHTRRFCRYFRDRGHEVHLYDGGTDWKGLEGIVQHAPDPVRFPESDPAERESYTHIARLREIITAMKPNWVHGHYLVGRGWWAALAAADTPLALTAWGSDILLLPEEKSQARNLTYWSVELADYLTADSTAVARAAEQLTGGRKQVALVPFGIDTTEFHPGVNPSELRRRLMIPENARVILSSRQIKPGSNLQFIIDGFAEVAKEEPDTLLVLKTYLTTFEKQSEFMALIRTKITEMGLWDRTRIVHDLPAELMPAMYALAEMSVSVRDIDGMPCTVFESMAAGTPVIAGDIPSITQWVTDGQNGLVVPTRSGPAIAQAIRRVLAGEPVIEKIKAQAREFAVANGDYRHCFARIDKVYCQPPPRDTTRKSSEWLKHGQPTTGIEKLKTARAEMCAAIDRGDHEEGFKIFCALNQMIADSDLKAAVQCRQPKTIQLA